MKIVTFIIWSILYCAGLILKDSNDENKSALGYTILTFSLIGYFAMIIIIAS